MNTNSNKPVSQSEYDRKWIEETWGWDTPDEFLKSQGRNLRPRIKKALDLAALKPGMRVLDIGCGRGETVLYCGCNQIDAVGADYSAEAIELGRKVKVTYPIEQQTFMHFICGDVKVLETGEKFDRILMLDLVEHLHDWELAELFALCDKLLVPDGMIIIHTLPNKWLYDITYRRIIRFFMPWLPANPRSEKEMKIHINEMSIIHLTKVLTAAGFNNRVWLQDLMVEQARWHRRGAMSGRRSGLYRWLARPGLGAIFKLLTMTPLRLLIVNDIFAVAWKRTQDCPLKLPGKYLERMILSRTGDT